MLLLLLISLLLLPFYLELTIEIESARDIESKSKAFYTTIM